MPLTLCRWPRAAPADAASTRCLAGLVRNGKAAGERMNRHYKARGVRTLPYFEVYDGANIVDQLDASTLSLKSGDSP